MDDGHNSQEQIDEEAKERRAQRVAELVEELGCNEATANYLFLREREMYAAKRRIVALEREVKRHTKRLNR